MGYPTRVQLIQRQKSAQWYVNLPAAVAQACEFTKAEVVEWVIQDQNTLILKRVEAAKAAAAEPRKKKR
jgi:antitoxin component of MazEF toxin-antitoxin module